MRALNIMRSCLSRMWEMLIPMALVLSAVLAVPHTFAAGIPQDGRALSLDLASERAYAGEAVPLRVRLRNPGRTIRNVGYPRIETHGLPAIATLAAAPRQGEGESAQVFVFSGTVTPDKAGTFLIGPARLECEVMEAAQGSSAFFGGVEPRTVSLASEPVSLTVLPLPAAGRPDTFSGAVGSFTLNIVARPDSAAIGDPLTITAVIGGMGNLTSAACPSLAGAGFRSYPVRASQTNGQLR
ncbi:MAG: BatD family protein, partial [Geobacter sp.]|nr:BatD family protein [Geobacter sp.]